MNPVDVIWIVILGSLMYLMHKKGGCCSAYSSGHEGGSCHGSNPSRETGPNHKVDGDMVADPVCGMYVDKDKSIKKLIDGDEYHFCSQHCADSFEPKKH